VERPQRLGPRWGLLRTHALMCASFSFRMMAVPKSFRMMAVPKNDKYKDYARYATLF
jgi:hypothetical protein